MAKVSEKERVFLPLLGELHEDAIRLGVSPVLASGVLGATGIIFKYRDLNVYVPVEIQDAAVLRFIMEQMVRTANEAYVNGRRDAQMAQIAAMGLAVQEDGTLKYAG